MSTMTGDSANVEFGPCQVTYNGVDLGYFSGGVTTRYDVGWYDVEADQSSMLIDSKVQSERFVATVPMLETVVGVLKNVTPTGTYTLDGTKEKIEFGGKQVSSSDFHELVLTPCADGSGTLTTDANEIVTVWKAIAKIQYSKAYNRSGARVVPVEFHAIKDSTKTAGKQLFCIGDTSAA